MRETTRRESCGRSSSLWILLMLAVLVIGCAKKGRVEEPNDVRTAQPAEETSVEAKAPAEPDPTFDAIPASVIEAWDMEAEASNPDLLLPGEVVTESPYDDLADVIPEPPEVALLDPEAILERQPLYDIPMEINEKVQFWIDYYTARQRSRFLPGYQRSGRYIEMFREILKERGLPTDLVYMAHVESAFKNTAYSRARAMGTWQFIASTARIYGLDINYWVDERRDPEKAARAAAAYLEKLYGDFGDWYLAMAAYNAGEGKIKRALARSGAEDFWGIAETRYIRRETKNYVPAVLAVAVIYKNPGDYGLDGILVDTQVTYDTVEVEGPVDLQVLADCSGTDFETMKSLNPMLRRYQTPPHATTQVRVPTGKGADTLAALERVPVEERVLYVRHRVRNGDTLYELARTYGVSVSAIQQTNEMGRRTMIRAGSELVIPTVAAGRYSDRGIPASSVSSSAPLGQATTYRVRRGDTLSHIAKRYGTTSTAIASASGISEHKTLQIGERLTVVPGVRSSSEARRIATSGTTTVAANGSSRVHTVRRGDTLWEIATRYNTTVERICALNQISQSQTLYPGTRLTVVP